jgi:quinol monooxygenase YgiN
MNSFFAKLDYSIFSKNSTKPKRMEIYKMTTTMFAKHKVNDYENWKRAYDEFTSVRKENGVTGATVHRDANDPSTVIITHQFKTTDDALAFVNSEKLKSAMMEAGVAGPPEFWFGEEIEKTAF